MGLACFDNLIGVKGECESTPSISGLYINDLPYLTVKNANSAIEEEQSGYQLLKEAIEVAKGYMINDIKAAMLPQYQYNSIISNDTVGYFKDSYTLVSPIAGSLKGVSVEIDNQPSMEFFVGSISLFVNFTGTVPVVIYDLMDGTLLNTINVETVAGEIVTEVVNVTIDKTRQKTRLFIGYDSTGISSYKTAISQSTQECTNCSGHTTYNNLYAYFKANSIPVASQKLVSNLVGGNETGGLSFDYSLNCSITNFICGMRTQFTYSLLFRTGIEVLQQFEASNRFNTVIAINRDKIGTFMENYEARYEQSLSNVIDNLKLPNDICFNCNRNISIKTSIP